MISRLDSILNAVAEDQVMERMWNRYKKENFFVGDLSWNVVNQSVKELKSIAVEQGKW